MVGEATTEPDFPRWQLIFPILVTFLLVGKVYSPQFSLWLLPWLVLVLRARAASSRSRRPTWRSSSRGSRSSSELTGVGGLPQWVFEIAVVVRAAVLVWCVVAWVREPSRRLPIEESGRPPDPGRARVTERRRLRDGLRPCLAVFLAARIGLSWCR